MKKSRFLVGLIILIAFVVLLGLLAWIYRESLVAQLLHIGVEQSLTAKPLQDIPDGLHVYMCGAGSPMMDENRGAPCVAVIAGRRLFLVDAGPGAARSLILAGLPPSLIQKVFLTHYHSDHIGGLGEILLQRWAMSGARQPLPVAGPPGVEKIVEGFRKVYSLDTGYRVEHHGTAIMPQTGAGSVAEPFIPSSDVENSPPLYAQEGLTVTALAVDHGPVAPAAAYRFDYKGRSIVLSGDTKKSVELAQFAHGADILFHDAISSRFVNILTEVAEKNGRLRIAKISRDILNYHASPEDAAKTALQAEVNTLVLYHIVPPIRLPFQKDIFSQEAKKIFPSTVVSTDGDFYSLPANSTEVIMENWR